VKTHQSCPDCGSRDALTDYGDHTFCFSCGKHSGSHLDNATSGNLLPLAELGVSPLPARGISAETCRKFAYRVTDDTQVACYFDSNGNLLYQKTRDCEKNFKVLKADTPATQLKHMLFGRHLWGDHGGAKLLITEGEIDCLSAHEALGMLGVHCVSVPCGAQGALETLKLNLDWIDRYQAIYLGFDNDAPGKKATQEICQALGSQKLHLLNIPPDVKDINELLVTGGRQAVLESFHEAKQWKPLGIISPQDFMSIVTSKPTRGYPWPWPTLNHTTYGIIPGMTLVAAGSGVGKTTWFKQVEAHCYQLGLKIGVIHLEESARNTINGLLSLIHGKPFHTPDSSVSEPERERAVASLVEDNRLVLFDKQIGFDEDIILSTLAYMVQGLGCHIVFLDHLTAITDQYDRDVNQRTRNFIVKLGKLVTRLEFPLFAISHLRKSDGTPHEEGGRVHLDDLLGAGAIKQWAEHVFALERDNQNEDPNLRNRPMMRDLKNRPLGEFTGTVVPLQYCPITYTLKEVESFGTTASSSSEPTDF
jgi:twinkle protein